MPRRSAIVSWPRRTGAGGPAKPYNIHTTRTAGKSPLGSAGRDETRGVAGRGKRIFRMRFDDRETFTTENTENHRECTEERKTRPLPRSCEPGGVGTAHRREEPPCCSVVLGVLRGKTLPWLTRTRAEPPGCAGSRGAGEVRSATLAGSISRSSRGRAMTGERKFPPERPCPDANGARPGQDTTADRAAGYNACFSADPRQSG
jgi:hypothetical protein